MSRNYIYYAIGAALLGAALAGDYLSFAKSGK